MSITRPGAMCFRTSSTPNLPSPCRKPITPILVPGSSAGLPARKLHVRLYRLHEAANIAAQQALERREGPPLRAAGFALAAPASLVSAAQQRERAVERVNEQPRQP